MSVGAIRAGRAMVEIFADSSMLSRGLATAQGKMARFASTLRRLGTAQVVVGASFAAPIAAAVIQYAKLEQRINTVRALTGANANEMRKLSDQIRRIGMTTGMAFTDIAEAMAELSRAGVKLGDLGKATRVIADFSRSAGIDMARAANIGVEILTQFGLSMEHLPRVADVLQEMANATVSTVEELSDGFRYAGQSASMFGLSLEEAAAAIAYLQQSGLSASTAGTSLNQMLLQIVQNMDKLEGAIGGLRDNAGEFVPFEQVLRKLQAHLKGMPGPERMQFLNEMFDVRGMRGAHALLKNIEEWLRLTAMAQASSGATARKAAEMAKAFVVSFDKMKNGVAMFGYAIGEALDKDLRFAFDAIGRVAERLADFIKKNQGIVQAVAKTAAALVASGVAFFTTGIAIQLAIFSLEGFIKVASGVAGIVLAPFKMVSTAASMTATAFLRMTRYMIGLGRIGMRLVGSVFMPLRAAIFALGAALPVLATSLAAAARASLGIVSMSVAAVRGIGGILLAMAAVPGAAFRMITVFRVIGDLITEVLGAATSITIHFAIALGSVIPAIVGLAGGLGVVAAAVVAVGVALSVAERLWGVFVATAQALGNGLPKIWNAFVARSKSVWPELVATAKTGWAGVSAAIESGDLALAWRIFVDTSRAAFAEIMMIIGPFVDDAAEMLYDIGLGLYRGIEWAVKAAGDLFWGLRTATQPVFEWLAGIGHEVLGSFDGFGEVFSRLGDYAEEGGNRIYDALDAGDIVAAWAAAITAIRKMLIDLGSFYEQHVGAPVRLLGQELGGREQRNQMLGRHGREFGREFYFRTAELSMLPQSHEELNQQEANLLARPDIAADPRRQDAIREAARFRRDQLRAAGVMDPAAREADRQQKINEAEADFQRNEEERKKRRAKNEEDRRRRADEARGRAESGAGVAGEARRNREMERGIDAATKPKEFDAQQKEIDARRKEREIAENDSGVSPLGVNSERAHMEALRREYLEKVQRRRDTLADAVGSGDITEEQANVHSALLDQAEAATNAAQTSEQLHDTFAELNEAAAAAANGFGEDAMVPAGRGLVTPEESAKDAEGKREQADREAADLEAAQAADNAEREKEAQRLRAEAHEARRQGDEDVARAKEETATALEQALDSQEEAEMQSRLDARREEFRKQEELRNQAGKGKEAGGRAAEDKRLDAIGGFMNSAFDRLGFGSNLTERQLKAAEETRDGVNNLVRMARDGGIFIA